MQVCASQQGMRHLLELLFKFLMLINFHLKVSIAFQLLMLSEGLQLALTPMRLLEELNYFIFQFIMLIMSNVIGFLIMLHFLLLLSNLLLFVALVLDD